MSNDTSLQVRMYTTEDAVAYAAFLASHPHAMLYHSAAYLSCICAELESTPAIALAMDEHDNICGALPYATKSGSYGAVLNSLPFYGSHGGVLATHDAAQCALIQWWQTHTQQSHIASATYIESLWAHMPATNAPAHHYTDFRIGQYTHIACPDNAPIQDTLMQRFHSKTRNMVRKGLKQGFGFSKDSQMLDFLYETHCINMHAIGGQAKQQRFFRSIPDYFTSDKDYTIWVARHGTTPVAAILVFYFNHTIEYFTPVIAEGWREAQPLSALIFHAMCDGAAHGFHWWNWGGTWESQEGVYHFKHRWGAQEHRYYYYTYVGNHALIKARPEDLLSDYPGFYTLPFSALKSREE